jgi:hypothetical protein
MTAPLRSDHEGSCHCGAIGFRYFTDRPPSSWSVRACQCGFCRAHHAATTSDPGARIEFKAADAMLLNRYRFARRTADFLICRRCGVYIGAVIETARGRFGIINVRALRPILPEVAPAVPIDYGVETSEQRIARREQRWSPVTGVLNAAEAADTP